MTVKLSKCSLVNETISLAPFSLDVHVMQEGEGRLGHLFLSWHSNFGSKLNDPNTSSSIDCNGGICSTVSVTANSGEGAHHRINW